MRSVTQQGIFQFTSRIYDAKKYTKPFNFNDIKSQYPQKIKALFNYFIRFQQIQNTDSSHLQLEVRFRRNQASPTIIQEILKDDTQLQPHTYRIYDDYNNNIEDHSEVPQAHGDDKCRGTSQYEYDDIQREIIKLSSVFKTIRDSKSDKFFATGKQGCGSFKGNDLLKFCLQWLVASYYKVGLFYYTKGDKILDQNIHNFFNLNTNQYTVSLLYNKVYT